MANHFVPSIHALHQKRRNKAVCANWGARLFRSFACRILSENFSPYFPYYPLHFLRFCFRIVLQILYSSELARGSKTGGNFMTKYKFSNKLMFALVMQDEELCTTLIERLFPDKKVRSLTFPNDVHITPEKTIVTGVLSRSVRLDVLFEGEDEYYDIEMQVETDPDLAKRARYYHTSMDTLFLKKSKPYSDLKPTYVIFICLHDPFAMGEPIYQFERFDRNLQLQLRDETYTIPDFRT